MPRMKLRRDSASGWTTANPVLLSGEPGIETDTGNIKVGNGSTAWNSLPYANAARFVDVAGDTMTGLLTLSADPSSNLHAATKQYADTKVSKAGDTMTGALTLHGNPSSALHAAPKQYVDAVPGVPTGVVNPFAGSSAPSGWLLCDGSAVSRTTYSALFAVISTTYGVGDGSTTFNLPDLRSRVPAGKAASGTFGTLGGQTGAETLALAVGNLPAHTHSIDHDHGSVTSGAGSAHGHTGTTASDGLHQHREQLVGESNKSVSGTGTDILVKAPGFDGGYMTTNDGTHNHTFTTSNESSHTHPVDLPNFTGTSGSQGSGTAFSLVQPTIVMHYIIKV